MTLHFKVPTISCDGCAESITKAIETADGNAKVSVDVAAKTVDVETQMSEASIKQLIQSVDHKIES
ncbi:MAG: heavy-metal-associated domain-containing protein [Cyanobacteriota bacterium]|nr:heavy-metal-associated domain-containing protein [Cyanobacteriota bacterium]